jgi:hypothetical protein
MSSDDDDDSQNSVHGVDGQQRRPRKKQRKRPVTIPDLIDQEDWEQVRKRLQKTTKPKTAARLLGIFAEESPALPTDFFEILFAALGRRYHGNEAQGSREDYQYCYNFWRYTCLYDPVKHFSREGAFYRLCQVQTPSTLRLILKESEKTIRGGILPLTVAQNAIDRVFNQFTFDNFDKLKKQLEDMGETAASTTLTNDKCNPDSLAGRWQKVELIVRATQPKGLDMPIEQINLLKLLMVDLQAPNPILWLACTAYPHLAKRKDDSHGRLPLHWAAIHNNESYHRFYGRSWSGPSTDSCVFFAMHDVRRVEIVLSLYPKAAKLPDQQGVLPLEYLLNDEYIHWAHNEWVQRCALALIHEAPEALVRSNPIEKNGMMPFATVACIHDQFATHLRQDGASNMLLRKLNLTYAILQENPAAVLGGIKDTVREQFLAQRRNWNGS